MYNDYYINKISERSDRYGNYLLDMMDIFGVNSLGEIEINQAKEFYENLIKEENYARQM